MEAPVPAVEVADNADGAGVRGPDGEGRPPDPGDLAEVGAEPLVELLVAALGRQMQVEVPERRREGVRVLQREHPAVRIAHLQSVAQRQRGAVDDAFEEPCFVPLGQLHRIPALGEHAYALGVRPVCADHDAAVHGMGAEQRVRVGVRLHSGGEAVEQPVDARDGDLHPVRAVVELVAELVDGLLELEDGEQPTERVLAGREQAARLDDGDVAGEELGSCPLLPVLGRNDSVLHLGGRSRVGERPEHAGDVTERRALAAPLRQRARRLALEVEHDPVRPRPEHLAEVVVAVVADDASRRGHAREQAQLLADVLPAPGDGLELLAVRQVREQLVDLLVDRRGEDPERLGARLLGREGGVGRVGAENHVHGAGHLAEPPRLRVEGLRALREAFQREGPTVLLARDVLLHDAERGLHEPAREGVPAGERGDVGELVLGEEAQELELRVHAGLQPPVGLEDELLVEDDGAVRLLGVDHARLAELGAADGEPVHRPEVDRRLLPVHRRRASHEVDELPAEDGVGESLVDRPALRSLDDVLPPLLVVRAEAEQHLVDVMRARLEANLEERDREQRGL